MLTPSRKQQIQSIVPMYRALYAKQLVYCFSPGIVEPMHLEWCTTKQGYLSLRSVKDLTEEECERLSEAIGWNKGNYLATMNSLKSKVNGSLGMTFEVYFHLASLSVALPYYSVTTGLITVNEFIEAGVLQVKN